MSRVYLPTPQISLIAVDQITTPDPSSTLRVYQVSEYLRDLFRATGGICPLPVLLESNNAYRCIAGSIVIRALSQELGGKEIPGQIITNDTHQVEIINAIYPFLDSRRFQSIEIAHTLNHLLKTDLSTEILDYVQRWLTNTETYLLCFNPALLEDFRDLLYKEDPTPFRKRKPKKGDKQNRWFTLEHVKTMFTYVRFDNEAQRYVLRRINSEGVPSVHDLRSWLQQWKKT